MLFHENRPGNRRTSRPARSQHRCSHGPQRRGQELLIALTEEDQARVGSLSEDTGKGRHTTTASRLYHLKNGARIIDTPGIREFGLGSVSLEELKAAFPEFSGERCRFNDCTHKEEPDCAIREAGGPRYEAWLRLLKL